MVQIKTPTYLVLTHSPFYLAHLEPDSLEDYLVQLDKLLWIDLLE